MDSRALCGEGGADHPALAVIAAVKNLLRGQDLSIAVGATPATLDDVNAWLVGTAWAREDALGANISWLTVHDVRFGYVGVPRWQTAVDDPTSDVLRARIHEAGPQLADCYKLVGGMGGRPDELPLRRDIASSNAVVAYWAASAAVLLGDRGNAVEALASTVTSAEFAKNAVHTVFPAMPLDRARLLLEALVDGKRVGRSVLAGVSSAGDSLYLPWVIEQMSDPKLARLAGESFSMITGLDLAYLDLDRKPPEDFESGPNDDPNDPNVDMDEDEGLPWPDQEKVAAWWKVNSHRFPPGQRFFMGKPPSMEHCLHVLKEGYQRQRMAAAIWRCILQPGTPLFPTDAPAWRQKRWLAQMTA
jgi:uncharacterized protein (TIGR02270 family)